MRSENASSALPEYPASGPHASLFLAKSRFLACGLLYCRLIAQGRTAPSRNPSGIILF